MAYQLFKRKSAIIAEPRLTIRNDKIALNQAAVDLVAKKGARWVHILWDSDNRKAAIRPALKQDENTYRLSLRGGQRGAVLSVGTFLKYIEWPLDGPPVAVTPNWNVEDHVLEATLPQQFRRNNRPTGKSRNQIK